MFMRALPLIAATTLAVSTLAHAQEATRLRPDTQLRPAPTDRPAGKGGGEAHDPSIDDPKAVEQQDLTTRCRAAGAPTGKPQGGALPQPAKTAEADETGNCIPAPSGQPLGAKAADKLAEPKE